VTVTVKRIGGSVAVVIPKGIARELELTDGTALELRTTDNSIVMQKCARRARRPLAKIVAQMKSASYRKRNRELSDDGPVGREVW
jgi:antitoxin component of MazEF toxin-antitoxin module